MAFTARVAGATAAGALVGGAEDCRAVTRAIAGNVSREPAPMAI